MTEEHRQMWADYFAHLANRMQLRDWRVRISSEDAHDDNSAQFMGIYGQKLATFKLAPEWEDYSPEYQRETAVHELIHAHFHPLDTYLRDGLAAYMSSRESAQYYNEAAHLIEFAIDPLSWAIAPNLALPGDVIPDLAGACGKKEGAFTGTIGSASHHAPLSIPAPPMPPANGHNDVVSTTVGAAPDA